MNALLGRTAADLHVLLVTPNYASRVSNVAQTTVGPPLGLACLAAVLEQRGFRPAILDANAEQLSDAETVAQIAAAEPQVIGFTAVTPTVDQCGGLATQVRTALPEATIVLGGIHATAAPGPTLAKFPAVDFLVRGEADTRFADLLAGLVAGRALGEFPGVTYRDADGKIAGTPLPHELEDLDRLPFPARHLLPMTKYVGPDGDRFTTLIGARGCPGRCIYCSVNQSFGGRLRNRAPQNVVAEMVECIERWGTRVFAFIDDTFSTARQWVLDLCREMTSRGVSSRARWLCLTRVDRVDPELLATMRAAGCFKVEFGIESGDQRVLNYLGKGTTTAQVRQAFQWARAAGLKTLAFVMLFSPAETTESLANTRRLVFEADPDLLQASFCTPYPGTRLAEELARDGIPVVDDWSAYVFLTGSVIRHPLFTPAQMTAWQRRLLRSFYLRPRVIWRLAVAALKDGSWRGFVRTAFAALRSLGKR
jgi:radical SAM superfamily enzyme YgiQ (UPF0313 family)